MCTCTPSILQCIKFPINHRGFANKTTHPYPGAWVSAQVEHDKVGVPIVRVLESGHDVTVVIGDRQVADGIGESDRRIVAELADHLVAE